jgi:hypothetical protein
MQQNVTSTNSTTTTTTTITTNTTSLASSSSSSSSFPIRDFPMPQVVILPGPHKAGSTSLQFCMVDWTQNYATDRLRQVQLERRIKRQNRNRRRWEKIQKRKQKDAEQNGENNIQKEEEAVMPAHLQQEPKLEPRVLHGWSWPIPLDSDLKEANLLHADPQKGFASLMAAVDDDPHLTVHPQQPLTAWEKNHTLQLFQTAMVQAWQNNSTKIVFGSEEFDRIAHPRNVNKNNNKERDRDDSKKTPIDILNSILEILPWQEEEEAIEKQTWPAENASVVPRRAALQLQDLEAVVVYRAPRVHHLRSLWHQVGGPNQTMADFITTSSQQNQRSLVKYAGVLDSLTLAQRFLEAGIRTTLLDLTGIPPASNLCHAVACHVMRDVKCNNQSQIASLAEKTRNVSDGDRGKMDVSTRKFNQRADGDNNNNNGNDKTAATIGLTGRQLEAMERIMRIYDCGLKNSLFMASDNDDDDDGHNNNNFRILFQHSLFQGCHENTPTRTLSWMVDNIQKIALGDL